ENIFFVVPRRLDVPNLSFTGYFESRVKSPVSLDHAMAPTGSRTALQLGGILRSISISLNTELCREPTSRAQTAMRRIPSWSETVLPSPKRRLHFSWLA